MVVDNKVPHMNPGNGEHSYSHNSALQKKGILKAMPTVVDALITNYDSTSFPRCFHVAEFGCSTGTNSVLPASVIIDTVAGLCRKRRKQIPEFHLSLNDLPENDFNSILVTLPDFYDKLNKEKGVEFCYASCVPGSFYGRLFPTETLHFAHSSYSVQWLSKVPDGIGNNNRRNIYMAQTSPPNVFEAYSTQYQSDFSEFLSCRAAEMVAGGQMILTFIGRSIADPTSKDGCSFWELLSKSLLDMAREGLVKEADIDSFNLPFYSPHSEEVKNIVQTEGSFIIDSLKTFEINWDPYDDIDTNNSFPVDAHHSAQNTAKTIRAVAEPMLTRHFGGVIMDDLFRRYTNRVAEDLAVEKTKYLNVVVCLTKKK